MCVSATFSCVTISHDLCVFLLALSPESGFGLGDMGAELGRTGETTRLSMRSPGREWEVGHE